MNIICNHVHMIRTPANGPSIPVHRLKSELDEFDFLRPYPSNSDSTIYFFDFSISLAEGGRLTVLPPPGRATDSKFGPEKTDELALGLI